MFSEFFFPAPFAFDFTFPLPLVPLSFSLGAVPVFSPEWSFVLGEYYLLAVSVHGAQTPGPFSTVRYSHCLLALTHELWEVPSQDDSILNS